MTKADWLDLFAVAAALVVVVVIGSIVIYHAWTYAP